MSKNKFLKAGLLLSLLALALSGCSLNFNLGPSTTSNAGATDGGVFKSVNKGDNWQQKTLIMGVGRLKSFAADDIVSLAMDPSDNRALYAGGLATGLYYTYDSADGWQAAAGLAGATVANVAVDPANKCLIYLAVANKVFKSGDCSRSWSGIYFDNELNVRITALAIDSFNSNNVFIGTSRGEIIASSDRGATWRTLFRFDSQVDKIVISPASSKVMFVGANSKGLFRSLDGGVNWASLSDKLKAFDDYERFRDLAMIPAEKSAVFLATDYGLLKSSDDGANWSKIELITPESQAKINSLAVNPQNGKEIYYVTNTTFYRSLDGGKNWTSRKLPTNRAGVKLLIDQKNPAVIYLAAKKVK